jgi:molecular chaperone DnaK
MQTVGIDLGTTNTVAAVNAAVLPRRFAADASPVVPSVVAYLPSGEVAVGQVARERRGSDVANTLYSAKRVIGERWLSYPAREFCAHYPFDLIPTSAGLVGFRTRAGVWTATEVATEVLRALCRDTGLDPSQTSAVVTVPASFGPAQRLATLQAVSAAGFARGRCIAEPIATALAYLDRNDVHHGVVYDFGGGTFDLAIIDCSVEPLRIVAHDGDPYLGGDDIDYTLASWAADFVLREHGWDLRTDREVFTRLTLEAERAKIRLSQQNATTIELASVDAAAPVLPPIELDRALVWQLSAGLIKRTFVVCDQLLANAGLTVRDIQAVFLAGGATLLPGVRDTAAEYFGKKLRFELDPMHVVALGASIAAARPRLESLLFAG